MTDKQAALHEIYDEYTSIEALQPSSAGQRVISGSGPLDSPLVIVGEVPYEDEERQLLQRMLKDAGVGWEMCYVTTTMLWSLPGGRMPYPLEITASMHRVQSEVLIIGPSVVIAAGAVAFQALTSKEGGPFPAARSKWMSLNPLRQPGPDIMMLSIFSPGEILRAPAARRALMEAETREALASILAGERVAV